MRVQFLVPTLASSHQALALVHCGNELVRKGHEVHVFVEDKGAPPSRPHFPVFDAAYAYTQPGPLIVTTLSSLALAVNSPIKRDVWFYAWDMEWLNGQAFAWRDLHPMYTAVPLIARSYHHRRILQNTWGKNVSHIVEDFSADQIERLLCP